MSWTIRVGSVNFERKKNAGVMASVKCLITSTGSHTMAQLNFPSHDVNAAANKAAPDSNTQADQAWQHVLSLLVNV